MGAPTRPQLRFTGTGKPYVHSSGIWVYGYTGALTETSPFAASAVVAWREQIEKKVTAIAGAVKSSWCQASCTATEVALPNLISGAPRDDAGALTLVVDGTQHGVTVHVDDLAGALRQGTGT